MWKQHESENEGKSVFINAQLCLFLMACSVFRGSEGKAFHPRAANILQTNIQNKYRMLDYNRYAKQRHVLKISHNSMLPSPPRFRFISIVSLPHLAAFSTVDESHSHPELMSWGCHTHTSIQNREQSCYFPLPSARTIHCCSRAWSESTWYSHNVKIN